MHAQDLLDVLENNERLQSSLDFQTITNLTEDLSGKDFKGELKFSTIPSGLGITVLLDEKKFLDKKFFNQFPINSLGLTIKNGVVSPDQYFFMGTEHPFFNIHFGVGYSKKIKGEAKDLITLPFSFLHKNANCVHNGIMITSYDGQGFSNTIFQISSETCAYLKFDYVSVFETTSKNLPKKNKPTASREAAQNFPISDVYVKYKINTKVFADNISFKAENVTLFGLVDDNAHYVSECNTRAGKYPICDQLLLPSYSLAKTLSGSLSMSLIENSYEQISSLKVSDLIAECDSKKWGDVTLENLSDMATGNFFKLAFDEDESGLKQLNFIFDTETSRDKVSLACDAYPRKSRPGKRFVYHTSDTYLLGESYNNYLKSNTDLRDYYSELLVPFLNSIGASYAMSTTLRTADESAQPLTGWGMYMLRTDLVKLSKFFHMVMDSSNQKFSFLKDGLTNFDDVYDAIPGANIFYNNGFWIRKYKTGTFSCNKETWVPFMSGFGGITVAFLPNNMTYYYFSDGYTFSWDTAVFAANEIRPFCKVD